MVHCYSKSVSLYLVLLDAEWKEEEQDSTHCHRNHELWECVRVWLCFPLGVFFGSLKLWKKTPSTYMLECVAIEIVLFYLPRFWGFCLHPKHLWWKECRLWRPEHWKMMFKISTAASHFVHITLNPKHTLVSTHVTRTVVLNANIKHGLSVIKRTWCWIFNVMSLCFEHHRQNLIHPHCFQERHVSKPWQRNKNQTKHLGSNSLLSPLLNLSIITS